ncbi:MAG: hypothetical protein AB8H03_21560 [Saprospiraceae bacterium]
MKHEKLKELNLLFIPLTRDQKLKIKGGIGSDDIEAGIGNDDIECTIVDDLDNI